MRKLFTTAIAVVSVFLLTTSTTTLAQQTITVKGKVTDKSTGDDLIAVSIQLKGSKTGAASSLNGNYTINGPSNGTLIFTYLGYQRTEIAINNRTTIDVQLASSDNQLEQVVVVGYGTQKKRDLTGSISSVKGEDLAKMPATNFMSSLQGKVAGLTVLNSGRAGSSPTVRIRGVNSTNNSDPLYVVDGVFQTNIDYLNPADIQNIEVLRDPSSIAIFGLQGGNGVIIVTTKRAAKGETRITFQSSVGLQTVQNQIDVADGAGFQKLYAAQLANLNAAPFDFKNYTGNTNWQDLAFRDAAINSNSLSISNNGEKSTTYINLGYNNQDGVLRNDNYKKFIGRFNQEIRINKNLKIGGDFTGFHFKQVVPGVDLNNVLWAAPIVPVQQDADLYYSMPSFQRAQVGNPIANLNRNDGNSVNNGYRAIASLFGEVKVLKQFTWRSSAYTDLGFNNNRAYTPLAYTFVNLGEGNIPTTTTRDISVKTGVSQAQSESRKFQQDHTLSFDSTFSQKHRISAVAGFTSLYNGNSNISGNRRDTTLNIPRDPAYWYLGISQQSNPGNYGGGGGEEAYMSFLGRVNYSFNGKYLVNATFRRDGSSKFSPENRWGNFGSIGLGWVVSDENFFKSIKGLDFLKLRGAWGTVGSGLGLPANLYLPALTTAGVGVFGDNVYPSVTPAYVPDPNLHWEVVRGIDLGLDLRALNNRLTTEITLYDRTTKDILTTLTLPGSAGNYAYRTNLGNITNKGVEVSMGWNDRIGKDFTYSLSPNFSYNKNIVESIGDNINFQLLGNGGVNRTETGQSIGYFYGYRQAGIYQATADLDRMPAMGSSLPGDIAYEDINGDGIISDLDRTNLGTPFPLWNYGLNLSMGYKGFDAIVEGQGVAGNHIYTQRRTPTFAILNYESNRLNAWSGPGTSNIEPVLDNTRANNYLFSTHYLEPGDYFRLRTVQLGYTVGSKALNKAMLKQLRFYVSGQNIKTFSKTTGYTPEASLGNPIASGADNGTYPVPAVYTFGLNATF